MTPTPTRYRTGPGAVLVVAGSLLAPPLAAQLPTLEPVGEPIGCAACADTRAFGAVMGLSMRADGGLAVADRDEPMVRLFAPDGSPEAAFGNRGGGPGEIRRIESVAATAAGTYLVSDFMGRALTEFDGSGALVELHPVESTVMGLRAGPTGRWIAWQVADWATFTAAVHLRAVDGSHDGVPLPTTAGTVVDAEGEAAAAGLFAAAPGPDGRVALGHPMVYRIEVRDRDGALLHAVARDIERTRRTPAEIEALEAAFDRMPTVADNPEAGARRPDVDPLRPHFRGHALAYDDRGRLWVRTARAGPEATRFDVFDARGAHLGEVDLPVFLGTFTVGHGVLAGVVDDPATGVQRIHRWRIAG